MLRCALPGPRAELLRERSRLPIRVRVRQLRRLREVLHARRSSCPPAAGNAGRRRRRDASRLLANYSGPPLDILVDQGDSDTFLAEQLKPDTLVKAASGTPATVELRMHEGYDHSFFFINTFIGEHVRKHAAALHAAAAAKS